MNQHDSRTLRIARKRGEAAYQEFVGRVFGAKVAAAIAVALREEGKTWEDYAQGS